MTGKTEPVASRRPPAFLSLFLAVSLLAGAMTFSSCGKDDQSPSSRILSLLESAEEAAEGKDISALKAMVSEQYGDSAGNDSQSLVGLLRYHFLRNESIHLLTRAGDPRFPSASSAEVTVLVAMAGEPIPTAESLSLVRADLYRFDLTFAGGGSEPWLLVTAQWRKASAGDFL